MRLFIRNIETLELDGGLLCLNFINTVRNRNDKPLEDYLTDRGAWLKWIKRLKIISYNGLEDLNSKIENHDFSTKFLKKIVTNRELLCRIFVNIANNKKPTNKDIYQLNKSIKESMKYVEIDIERNRQVVESWDKRPVSILSPLDIIMQSAYDLLRSDDLHKVKECENCGWLFLDRSKNKTKKWCNMQTCGSSVKSRKYYSKRIA